MPSEAMAEAAMVAGDGGPAPPPYPRQDVGPLLISESLSARVTVGSVRSFVEGSECVYS